MGLSVLLGLSISRPKILHSRSGWDGRRDRGRTPIPGGTGRLIKPLDIRRNVAGRSTLSSLMDRNSPFSFLSARISTDSSGL